MIIDTWSKILKYITNTVKSKWSAQQVSVQPIIQRCQFNQFLIYVSMLMFTAEFEVLFSVTMSNSCWLFSCIYIPGFLYFLIEVEDFCFLHWIKLLYEYLLSFADEYHLIQQIFFTGIIAILYSYFEDFWEATNGRQLKLMN